MGFKKHNWVKYGEKGNVAEITIRDQTGRKLDFFRFNNNSDYQTILGMMKKYGFSYNSSLSKKKEDDEIKNEINWLKKEMEW